MGINFTRSLGEESGVQLNPLVDGSDIPTQGAGDQNFAIAMRCLRGRIDKPFSVSSDVFYRKMGYGEPMRVNELNEAWVHVYEALNNGAKHAIVQRLVANDYVNNWLSFNISDIGENGEKDFSAYFANQDEPLKVNLGGELSLNVVVEGGSGDYSFTWFKDGNGLKGQNESTLNVTESINDEHAGVYMVRINDNANPDYNDYISVSCTVIVNAQRAIVTANARKSKQLRNLKSPIDVTLESLPSNNFEISIKHHECFNDGISISIHADENRNEMSQIIPSSNIRLRVLDSRNNKLFDFSGSLNPDSRDDYGASNYLPDVIELLTSDLEIRISDSVQEIDPMSPIYGFDEFGQEKWITTDVVQYFDEGTIGGYTTEDYYNACVKLEKTDHQFKYIASGGNKNTALINQLADLAYRTNRQFRFDVFVSNGNNPYTVDEMIRMVKGMYGEFDPTYAHLVHAYWTPLKCNDPTGVNGRVILGTSTLNIALACKRNGMKNAKGFAPKNYPIAGKMFPVNRRGVTQIYTPSQPELSQLAQAKINPVVYESYEDGGLYIFKDSLTCAPVTNSLRKLIAVAEMSTSVDDAVTSTAKAYLQFPMDVAVKSMKDWLQVYFEGVQSADWIVPSNDPQMGGASFKFEVEPNALRPYDQMDLKYWVRYDGTNRQTFVTQTLTK